VTHDSHRRRKPVRLPGDTSPSPQPERDEPRLNDPGPTDLSISDLRAIAIRAGREAIDDNIMGLASAVAYHAFLAIPAVLLIALGVFGLAASPGTVASLVDALRGSAPADALHLVQTTLTRVTRDSGGSAVVLAVGLAVAVWTVLSSMTTLMWALNTVYERQETRGFLAQRRTAALMFAFAFVAVALTFGLLAMGPVLSGWVARQLGNTSAVTTLWWLGQWPLQVGGLGVAFAGILYLGPDVDHPRWEFVTPGAVFAVVAWLATSALFALYVATLGSYNRAWGSLASVIVMLTWLWLSSLALLFGAEVNAEAQRSRELRQGLPAERQVQAPTRG
jgi:membrane protein